MTDTAIEIRVEHLEKQNEKDNEERRTLYQKIDELHKDTIDMERRLGDKFADALKSYKSETDKQFSAMSKEIKVKAENVVMAAISDCKDKHDNRDNTSSFELPANTSHTKFDDSKPWYQTKEGRMTVAGLLASISFGATWAILEFFGKTPS